MLAYVAFWNSVYPLCSNKCQQLVCSGSFSLASAGKRPANVRFHGSGLQQNNVTRANILVKSL